MLDIENIFEKSSLSLKTIFSVPITIRRTEKNTTVMKSCRTYKFNKTITTGYPLYYVREQTLLRLRKNLKIYALELSTLHA